MVFVHPYEGCSQICIKVAHRKKPQAVNDEIANYLSFVALPPFMKQNMKFKILLDTKTQNIRREFLKKNLYNELFFC